MEFNQLLSEICEISAVKATAALSRFLKTPFGVTLNPIKEKELKQLQLFGDFPTINLSLPVSGNIPGIAFFVFSKQSAYSLCDILFQRAEGSTKNLTELDISALLEVANIVMGNFLMSFAQSLNLDCLMHSPAIFDFAPFNTTLEHQLSFSSARFNENVIEIRFSFQDIKITGYVLIVFEKGKINNVLNNLHMTKI